MKINRAILHVFDFTACENTYAREEIDPAEYSRNPEYITFTSEADGTISIQLKNIGSIENR